MKCGLKECASLSNFDASDFTSPSLWTQPCDRDNTVILHECLQDELLEMREREEAQEEEVKAAAKAATVAELMTQANLEGVDSLWDDMTVGDEDWPKLGQVRFPPFAKSSVDLCLGVQCIAPIYPEGSTDAISRST